MFASASHAITAPGFNSAPFFSARQPRKMYPVRVAGPSVCGRDSASLTDAIVSPDLSQYVPPFGRNDTIESPTKRKSSVKSS